MLGNLQVIIVGVVAWLAFGERPSRNTFLALPVVLVGVALISGASAAGAFGANPGLGVAFGLATAFCYSGYLLIIRRGGRDLRRPAGPVAIATVSTAVVAAIAGGVVGDLDLDARPHSLVWLAILGPHLAVARLPADLAVAVAAAGGPDLDHPARPAGA